MSRFIFGFIIAGAVFWIWQESSKPVPPLVAKVRANNELRRRIKEEETKEQSCKAWRVTQAPDGATLWKVSENCARLDNDGYPVYFSSMGVQTFKSEHYMAGKTPRTRTVPVHTPNTEQPHD